MPIHRKRAPASDRSRGFAYQPPEGMSPTSGTGRQQAPQLPSHPNPPAKATGILSLYRPNLSTAVTRRAAPCELFCTKGQSLQPSSIESNHAGEGTPGDAPSVTRRTTPPSPERLRGGQAQTCREERQTNSITGYQTMKTAAVSGKPRPPPKPATASAPAVTTRRGNNGLGPRT